LPSQARARTLTPEETKTLEDLFLSASGDEAAMFELIDRCKFKYNIVRLCDLPFDRFDAVKIYLEKLVGDLETDEPEPETVKPTAPVETLSVNRIQRIKDEFALAYGADKVQHHIKITCQRFNVERLSWLTVEQYKIVTHEAQQARVGRKSENGNGNGRLAVDTKSGEFVTMMIEGNEAYGKQWKTERKRIVSAVTDGRSDSAADLYADELSKVRAMVKAEHAEMVKDMVEESE
jgi:hypothetical protein